MTTQPQEIPTEPRAVSRLVAVIDIGATSIRMAIAEIKPSGEVQTLESLQQAVSLGKDTFTKGYIDTEAIDECVTVLRSFREILRQYQIVEESQIRAVATSAVREASNREAFLDRIYVATGIAVDVIDEAETNRITYLAVRGLINAEPSINKNETLIIEVGGGNTEALLLKSGQVTYSHTYHLGSLRLREMLEDYRAPVLELPEIMQIHIDRAVDQIRRRLSLEGSIKMLALGGDIRFACARLLSDWSRKSLARLPVSQLSVLSKDILSHSVDDLVRRYHLPYPDAETLGPALLIYVRLARALRLRQILVGGGTLRDGLMWEMAIREAWTEDFHQQIIHSALQIGRKYTFDEAHASHVANLCRKVFAALRREHRLAPRFETILIVAALLHDVGLFVSNRSHHKHSMYLIMNSDLFGLGARDLELVGMIARYHRRALPRPTHEGYARMDRQSRVAVSKLASILRVADALDSGHVQRIQNLELNVDPGEFRITVRDHANLMLERYALQLKGQMFEQVYGMKVVLRETG
ncbi:MAG: Ppx/GppA family phosphatase [Acidobacteria bacterium]|nr:MAG: Ppx/GppA family phosphatase [Acidobacteriota bacterium]